LTADIIAGMTDGDVYRPDCTRDAETGDLIEHVKTWASTTSMFGGISTVIFDECDRLSADNIARLKTAIDVIDRRKNDGHAVGVTVIFTTAKSKEELKGKEIYKHWDELLSRCVFCPIGVTGAELNEYFAKATGGELTNIASRLDVLSVRYANEYVKKHGYTIVDVPVDVDPFIVPESCKKRVESQAVSVCRCSCGKSGAAPKKQQNLIGVIAGIVKRAGSPLSAAMIRSALDESGEYEFKRGVEGWRKTNQITSAIYNHIAKYGESALLQKVDGGYATREGGVL
jgi:hypothetical protein